MRHYTFGLFFGIAFMVALLICVTLFVSVAWTKETVLLKNVVRTGILALILVVLYSFYLWYTREQVILKAENSGGRYAAEIIWKRYLSGGGNVSLVIKEVKADYLDIGDYRQIFRCDLLGSDYLEAAKSEIKEILWINNTVVLKLDRHFYRGPSTFEIHEPLF